MLHKEFWGLVFMAFVVWVLIAGNPSARIENVCRPVGWTGNVTTSLSALVLPDQQLKIQGWFNKLEYGCRYTVWRLFYQDDYNAWLQKQKDLALQKSANGEAEKKSGAASESASVEKSEKGEEKSQ